MQTSSTRLSMVFFFSLSLSLSSFAQKEREREMKREKNHRREYHIIEVAHILLPLSHSSFFYASRVKLRSEAQQLDRGREREKVFSLSIEKQTLVFSLHEPRSLIFLSLCSFNRFNPFVIFHLSLVSRKNHNP